jgi:neutral amino acid transport system ATP-binding protein
MTDRGWIATVERVPGAAKPDPILVVDGVQRRFGGLLAVNVDHLEVQRGSITALIGPNGAGKTTLFNLLTGFDRADGGTWKFDGRSIDGLPAHRVAEAGMVRTFQLTKALARMTVLDNMLVGAHQPGESFFRGLGRGWQRREAELETVARDWLQQFNLTAKVDDYAGEMSGGQRKLLEMARALMSEPTVLMLDEPMAGVNPALTQSLLGHIHDLRDRGITVVFVEHDMDVVMDISDWVIVMAEGQVVAEGPPSHIGTDPVVIDAYLGTNVAAKAALAEREHPEHPEQPRSTESIEDGDG